MKRLFLKSNNHSETVVYIEYDTWDTRLNDIFKDYSQESYFQGKDTVEYGATLYFRSPFCSNVSNILDAVGITGVKRVEQSTNILRSAFKPDMMDPLVDVTFNNITTLDCDGVNPLVNEIVPYDDIQTYGETHGLAFDKDDIQAYTRLFRDIIGRYPTSTELYDLSQGNSEHSRHWFFTGKIIVDGSENRLSLLDKIKEPLRFIRSNNRTHDISLVAFSDNASAIQNNCITTHLNPISLTDASLFKKRYHLYHPTLTAETHNFPTGIAPFQGAETGVGGRLRDTEAIGRGGIPVAGLAGYAVGHFGRNYDGCHEAVDVLYKASDGASDYGNNL